MEINNKLKLDCDELSRHNDLLNAEFNILKEK